MYQIIDCTSRTIIFESENLDRAIKRFEMIKEGIPPFILFANPHEDVHAAILQKVERIDTWQQSDKEGLQDVE